MLVAVSSGDCRAGTAHQALAYIGKLYRIESELSEYRESDPDRFQAERRARAQPVLDKMYGWLRQKQNQVVPGTALGKALALALGQWTKLIRYLDHPLLTVGQQLLRADDPALRDPAQELAVFR